MHTHISQKKNSASSIIFGLSMKAVVTELVNVTLRCYRRRCWRDVAFLSGIVFNFFKESITLENNEILYNYLKM